MTSNASPTVLRRRLGLAMRNARNAAGLSAEKAGAAIEASQSKISRFEIGLGTLRVVELEALARHYQLDEERVADLVALLRQSRSQGWWEKYRDIIGGNTYLEFEASATEIRSYDLLIPGLYQTIDYARAIIRAGNPRIPDRDVDRLVESRIARQQLVRSDSGPYLWTIIDECALRRVVGGTAVMIRQLEKLIEIASERLANIQIAPFDSDVHLAPDGAFTVLGFADLPTLGFVEYSGGGALWLEEAVHVQKLREIHGDLISESPSQADSVDLIEKRLRELRGN